MPPSTRFLSDEGLRALRWPSFVAVIAVVFGMAVSAAPRAGAAGDCAVSPSEAAADAEEQRMLSLINAYRQTKGLGPLAFSPSLNRAAAWMSRDMATKRYFSHTDSTGRSAFARMTDCGYTNAMSMAENIAGGHADAAATLEQWKNSPGHNTNLLKADARVAGIGRYSDPATPYRHYWTLNLGGRDDSGATPVTTAAVPSTGLPAGATSGAGTAGAGTMPFIGQPAQGAVPPVAAPGTVTISVRLINANGQPVQGDLSGYVFTLAGAGGTQVTPPTNAQGLTSLSLPAGTYALGQQPRAGATLAAFMAGSTPATNVTVSPSQTATLVAVNRVAATAQGSGGTTTGTTTGTTGMTTGGAAAPATAQTAAATTLAGGTVSFSVAPTSGSGASAPADLSGYVFTLKGDRGTYTTMPTNAQGQTMLALPAGVYTVAVQPRTGTTVTSVSVGGASADSVKVIGGQTTPVTVGVQLNAAAAPVQSQLGSQTQAARPAQAAAVGPQTQAAQPAQAAAATTESLPLLATCNNVSLTWLAGTSLSTVAAAIAPANALRSIWRWDHAQNRFAGYSPLAGARNDYAAVMWRFEPVFICMNSNGTITRPAG